MSPDTLASPIQAIMTLGIPRRLARKSWQDVVFEKQSLARYWSQAKAGSTCHDDNKNKTQRKATGAGESTCSLT
eukprot:2677840-Rhodomonas_salina.1